MKPLPLPELARAKILVRVPNWIGDAVLCLPALRALRAQLPEADLVFAARPWVAKAFPLTELRCRIFTYDTHGPHKGIRGRWRAAAELRREGFAAAVLFQNALDAALLAVLARIPVRAGYARQGRGPLLTHAAPVPFTGAVPAHEVYYYLELLRRLGIIPQLPEVTEIGLPSSAESRARGRARLETLAGMTAASGGNGRARPAMARPEDPEGEKLIVGMSPGAAFGTAKRWLPERFADLARRLHEEWGAATVFFGSAAERPLLASLLPAAGPQARSLAGETTLAEFLDLVQGCDLYVTNDSGAMHLAAALGVPTLALFGATDEQGTRPLGRRVRLAVGEAPCRPCKLRHCPIDHRCMKSLAVDHVLRLAGDALRESAREPYLRQV